MRKRMRPNMSVVPWTVRRALGAAHLGLDRQVRAALPVGVPHLDQEGDPVAAVLEDLRFEDLQVGDPHGFGEQPGLRQVVTLLLDGQRRTIGLAPSEGLGGPRSAGSGDGTGGGANGTSGPTSSVACGTERWGPQTARPTTEGGVAVSEETPEVLERLQAVLDASYARAGAHLRTIHTDAARLSAAEVCTGSRGCGCSCSPPPPATGGR
jgi:hypothetical protein